MARTTEPLFVREKRGPQCGHAPGFAWLSAIALLTILGIVPRAAHGNLLALLESGAVFLSTNAGTAWVPHASLPVPDAVGIAAGSSPALLYVATRTGSILQSDDGGLTWAQKGAVPASDVTSFVLLASGSIVVLTTSGVVFSADDSGTSFTATSSLNASNLVALCRGPLGRLYALTGTGEVYESPDGGVGWLPVGAIATSAAVAICRLGQDLFVEDSAGDVHRSRDYGRTWLAVGTTGQSHMRGLTAASGVLVAITLEGEVATSPDAVNWTWVGLVNQTGIVCIGVDTPQITGVEIETAPPRPLIGAPCPNPSSSAATFTFSLPQSEPATLELFDVAGRLVARRPLVEFPTPGIHSIHWAPGGLAAGAYFVRLRTRSGAESVTRWTVLK